MTPSVIIPETSSKHEFLVRRGDVQGESPASSVSSVAHVKLAHGNSIPQASLSVCEAPDSQKTNGTSVPTVPTAETAAGVEPPVFEESYPGQLACSDTGDHASLTRGYPQIDFLSAQIGYNDHIPRWVPGEVLTYIIRTGSFPNSDDAKFTTYQLTKAIQMWKGVGVTFKQVPQDSGASFQVVYRDTPEYGQKGILSKAFLPNNDAPEFRTLHIYRMAFSDAHRNNQSNILAHEVGHILGLRHEFSIEKEPQLWSATWMERNPKSVMGYFLDSSSWCVQQQDLDELECFYNSSMECYHGRPVVNFTAQSHVYATNRRLRPYQL